MKFYCMRSGLVEFTEKWLVEAETKEDAEDLMRKGDAQFISQEVGDWDISTDFTDEYEEERDGK